MPLSEFPNRRIHWLAPSFPEIVSIAIAAGHRRYGASFVAANCPFIPPPCQNRSIQIPPVADSLVVDTAPAGGLRRAVAVWMLADCFGQFAPDRGRHILPLAKTHIMRGAESFTMRRALTAVLPTSAAFVGPFHNASAQGRLDAVNFRTPRQSIIPPPPATCPGAGTGNTASQYVRASRGRHSARADPE